ncbi:hypothetical protein [Streptosporangium sp. NPDC000509]|uniref:hypothetical protein n=1 Tax=Streptosporangium sp. NPDC000509 TaxID=3366186 RepID=UPI00368CFEA3
MTDTPETSEDTAEREGAGTGGTESTGAESAGAESDAPAQDPPPAGPRGIDGESRVVAERSGADTTFPERPLLADPDDARRTPEEERPEGVSEAKAEAETENEADGEIAGDEGEDTSGDGAPEPEVGPAS